MLVTLTEFKSSVYWEPKRSWTDTQVQQALDFAIDRFYRFTKRSESGYWLEPVETTLTLHGTGLAVLRCPYPMLSLSSVTVDDVDVTTDVTFRPGGHYIWRKTEGNTFGAKPTATVPLVPLNVVVVGTCGDPLTQLAIPWDVKDCVMRMVWHHLRKERLAKARTDERIGPSKAPVIGLTNDPSVLETLMRWSKADLTKTFDFR